MPISEKEHFDALRQSDQRAVELLAKAHSDRIMAGMLTASLLVSIIAVLVAIAAIAWGGVV